MRRKIGRAGLGSNLARVLSRCNESSALAKAHRTQAPTAAQSFFSEHDEIAEPIYIPHQGELDYGTRVRFLISFKLAQSRVGVATNLFHSDERLYIAFLEVYVFSKLVIASVLACLFSHLALADGFGSPVPGNGGSICGTNANPCPDLTQHIPPVSKISSIVCSTSGIQLTVDVRNHRATLTQDGVQSFLQAKLIEGADLNATLNYEVTARNSLTTVEIDNFRDDETATLLINQDRASFDSAQVPAAFAKLTSLRGDDANGGRGGNEVSASRSRSEVSPLDDPRRRR